MTGWSRTETPDAVDITPRGEEARHILDTKCECGPRLSRDWKGRLMIIHNSWDGREVLEQAEAKLPAQYRGRAA